MAQHLKDRLSAAFNMRTPGEEEVTPGDFDYEEAWDLEGTLDGIPIYVRNKQFDLQYNRDKYFSFGGRRRSSYYGRHSRHPRMEEFYDDYEDDDEEMFMFEMEHHGHHGFHPFDMMGMFRRGPRHDKWESEFMDKSGSTPIPQKYIKDTDRTPAGYSRNYPRPPTPIRPYAKDKKPPQKYGFNPSRGKDKIEED